MDVLRPALFWIDGQCYRLSAPLETDPSDDEVSAEPDINCNQDQAGEDIWPAYETTLPVEKSTDQDVYTDEPSCEVNPTDTPIEFKLEMKLDVVNCNSSKQYFLQVKIPAKYAGSVVGRKGATRMRIQEQTGTKIHILQHKEGFSTIIGETESSVLRALALMESIINSIYFSDPSKRFRQKNSKDQNSNFGHDGFQRGYKEDIGIESRGTSQDLQQFETQHQKREQGRGYGRNSEDFAENKYESNHRRELGNAHNRYEKIYRRRPEAINDKYLKSSKNESDDHFRGKHQKSWARNSRYSSPERYQKDNERYSPNGKDSSRNERRNSDYESQFDSQRRAKTYSNDGFLEKHEDDYGQNSNNFRKSNRRLSGDQAQLDHKNSRRDSGSFSQDSYQKDNERNSANGSHEKYSSCNRDNDCLETRPKDHPSASKFSSGDKDFIEISVKIPQELCGAVLGRSGITKKRIEFETKTQIFVPSRNESGKTIIKGRNPEAVISAKNRIELLMRETRQTRSATHFISVPLVNSEIKEKYLEFRKNVLETCGKDRGVDSAVFTFPDKIHLTFGVLVLYDEDDRSKAKQVLEKCGKEVIDPIVSQYPLVLRMKGIEYMNDDPAEVDILYAKVQTEDGSDRLQRLADEIVAYFLSEDMINKPRSVKLHATLMKSKGIDRKDAKGTFDAHNILTLFEDYDFGKITVTNVHLSERFSKSQKDNYYFCTAKFDFTQSF